MARKPADNYAPRGWHLVEFRDGDGAPYLQLEYVQSTDMFGASPFASVTGAMLTGLTAGDIAVQLDAMREALARPVLRYVYPRLELLRPGR